jgi:hypothetical protein
LEAAEDPALTINLVWVETCSDIFSADVECVNATTIVLCRSPVSSPAGVATKAQSGPRHCVV